jgi:hypothetical protein
MCLIKGSFVGEKNFEPNIYFYILELLNTSKYITLQFSMITYDLI